MIDFTPRSDELLEMPLDVIVWCKVTAVSYEQKTNYDFIRFLFSDEEVPSYLKDYSKTQFYDFDGTNTDQARFVTIFELNSLMNYASLSIWLLDLMNRYNHDADIVIDMYTIDDKVYRLSDIDGIVKLDELTK